MATAVVLSALVVAAPSAGRPAQSSDIVWYKNPSLTAAAQNFAASGLISQPSDIPERKAVCYAFGLGKGALSQKITWAVSDFTALAAPARGTDDTWYGSSACQLKGRFAGLFINRDSAPLGQPRSDLMGMHLAYKWRFSDNVRPWRYGASAALRLGTSFAVERRAGQGPNVAQYGQLFVNLVDATTSRSIWYVLRMWQTFPPEERVHEDAVDENTFNVDTYFGAGAAYATLRPDSQTISGDGACGCLLYSADITRANLVAALNAINGAGPPGPYSTNPDDYVLTFIGSGTEMLVPAGSNGRIGSRVWDVSAVTVR